MLVNKPCSYRNFQLKLNLWWVRTRERKKRALFVLFILSEWDFFNIFILFQCIMHWIHFQNTDTFTYQKTLLHTLFCFFLKSSKTFSVSLIKSYQKFLNGLSFNRACAFFSIRKSPTWSTWTTILRFE